MRAPRAPACVRRRIAVAANHSAATRISAQARTAAGAAPNHWLDEHVGDRRVVAVREEADLLALKVGDQHDRGGERERPGAGKRPAAHESLRTPVQQRDVHAVHDQQQPEVEEQVDAGGDGGRVDPPPPRGPAVSERAHEQHRQPHGGRRGEGVRAGLRRHVGRAGEDDADDAGEDREPAPREPAREHHGARDHQPDGDRARQPRRELGGAEQRDPHVQQGVVDAVDRIDLDSSVTRPSSGRDADMTLAASSPQYEGIHDPAKPTTAPMTPRVRAGSAFRMRDRVVV